MSSSNKRTVLIMGLGLHGGGAAAANFFADLGDRVVVTDLKSAAELEEGLARIKAGKRMRFVLGRHEFRDFEEADLIVKNPGVPPASPYLARARERGVPIETDIGIFLDHGGLRARCIVGVTGTKGKSTTASLLHSILSVHGHALIGGNITVSVLDILPEVREDSIVVLELSSFQLGGIRSRRYSPHIAVFTNFLDDHLNYYESREAYFSDKLVMSSFQKPGDCLVKNRDNPVHGMVSPQEGVRHHSFGLDPAFEGDGSYVEGHRILYRRAGHPVDLLDVEDISLPGIHNLYNVLAAATAAVAMGITPDEVREGVAGFSGLPHRMEHVSTRNGVRFMNDSAATTPDAAIQGILSLQGPVTLIAGGSDKGLDLRRFVQVIDERVSHLILLEGTGTRRLIELGSLGAPYTLHDNLEDAVRNAVEMAEPGTTVLLSPGFASFGMFKNEFDRGDRFRQLVGHLSEGPGV
jgi:UDP-N-acetylmuramoylalanine--D-glutamate ligase